MSVDVYTTGMQVYAPDGSAVTIIDASDLEGYLMCVDDKGTVAHYLHTELNYSFPQKKCECGAEKIGAPGHSHWCPKA